MRTIHDLWIERAGRRTRVGPAEGDLTVLQTRGMVWLVAAPGGLDVLVGDSLASTMRGPLAAGLRDFLTALRGPMEFPTLDRVGRIWIADGFGLGAVFHEGARWRLRRFGVRDGLRTGTVHGLSVGPSGRLWIGTPLGGQGFEITGPPADPRLRPVAAFAQADAYPTSIGPVLEDVRGTIWTDGGLPGFVALDLSRRPVETSPAATLASLVVNGRETDAARVRADTARLAFTLGAASFRERHHLRFEWRLVGLSERWATLSGDRTVRFGALPPGDYRFEARVRRGEAAPGPMAVRAFTVVPPFTRSWGFAGLVGLGLVRLGAGLYRVRAARTLALERQRLRIAADLHDELGSGLSRGVRGARGDRDQQGTEDTPALLAGQAGETARRLSGAMQDLVWRFARARRPGPRSPPASSNTGRVWPSRRTSPSRRRAQGWRREGCRLRSGATWCSSARKRSTTPSATALRPRSRSRGRGPGAIPRSTIADDGHAVSIRRRPARATASRSLRRSARTNPRGHLHARHRPRCRPPA